MKLIGARLFNFIRYLTVGSFQFSQMPVTCELVHGLPVAVNRAKELLHFWWRWFQRR
jgi:hypothetical protein